MTTTRDTIKEVEAKARSDAEVADTTHQHGGIDVVAYLSSSCGRVEQLSADGNESIEEVGVQRVEAGTVGLHRRGKAVFRDSEVDEKVDPARESAALTRRCVSTLSRNGASDQGCNPSIRTRRYCSRCSAGSLPAWRAW